MGKEEMKEFLNELMPVLIDMGDQIAKISKKLGIKSGDETSETDVESADEPLPIHIAVSEKFAICGAMGTPSQPFDAKMNEPVTLIPREATCPDCLRIAKLKQAEKEKS